MKLKNKPNELPYVVRGNVRGTISYHRTISGAVRARNRDRRYCRRLGGGAYSDVVVCDSETGYLIDTSAYEHIK